jgi:hypothetical protein
MCTGVFERLHSTLYLAQWAHGLFSSHLTRRALHCLDVEVRRQQMSHMPFVQEGYLQASVT